MRNSDKGKKGKRGTSLMTGVNDAELELLCLVRQGLSNKEIARSLRLSEKTIEAKLTTIYSKLGLCNRAQAAAYHAEYTAGQIRSDFIDLAEESAKYIYETRISGILENAMEDAGSL